MRIGFIGGGVMAEAMLKGILAHGLAQSHHVVVGEPVVSRRQALEDAYKVATSDDNRHAIDADVVILAVKPQQAALAMAPLAGAVPPAALVVSIMAGVRTATIRDALTHDAVVRVMPNTPAQVGEGMSAWTASSAVSPAQRETAARLLGVLGREIYLDDERYLDMATALSGSGPGYVLLFLEALIDAGVHIGLSRPAAELMARQTLLGTARLVEETGRHPAELRNMVTSPGGTTAEGLLALEEGGLRAAVTRAVIAAYKKSRSLG